MSHDAFISYSNKDKIVADAVCAVLEREKVRCWIAPRDINAGSEWGESIIEGINHSCVMVLVFSKSANDSPQIRREVERAVNKGVIIVPFRIEDVIPTKSLEYFIGSVHWLDALTPPIEHHLEKLAANVRRIVAAVDVESPLPIPHGDQASAPLSVGATPKTSSLITENLNPPHDAGAGETSKKAIGSLVCGLFFFLFPAAVAAIVLGHLSRAEIRKSAAKIRGARMALTGLVLGYTGAMLIPLSLILAIMIPNLMHARVMANESAARGALKTLSTAIQVYDVTYEKLPPDLKSLGPPAPGKNLSSDAADLIDSTLADGSKTGYKFTYSPGPGPTNFLIKAEPLLPGNSGFHYMSMDQTGEIQISDAPRN
jgi:hypothetical protein